MKNIFETYKPEGFSTINTYLFIKDAEKYIDFLKNTFEAKEINRVVRKNDNKIGNCILKIGESCFMLSEATEPFFGMRTSLYLYVNDVDFVFSKALENGSKEIFSPYDTDFGDRQAGIVDYSGNYWWISKRLSENGYHE